MCIVLCEWIILFVTAYESNALQKLHTQCDRPFRLRCFFLLFRFSHCAGCRFFLCFILFYFILALHFIRSSFFFFCVSGLAWPVYRTHNDCKAISLYPPMYSKNTHYIAFFSFFFINNVQYVLALACHSSIPININDSVVILRGTFFSTLFCSFADFCFYSSIFVVFFFLRFLWNHHHTSWVWMRAKRKSQREHAK